MAKDYGVEVMTASEARAKLESYVVILKARLEGTTPGPWDFGTYGGPSSGGSGYWLEGGNRKKGQHFLGEFPGHKTDLAFCVFSRSAVPALLAGIEAVLEEYADVCLAAEGDDAGPSGPWAITARGTAKDMLIEFAQSMEPYFKEVSE